MGYISTPVAFCPPDDIGRSLDGLTDYELGGADLNDASQGLLVQSWRVRLNETNQVVVGAYPYTSETVLFSGSGITELSLSFDQNMRPCVAYIQSGLSKLYWYDTVAESQVTTTLPFTASSIFLTLDDKRLFANSYNDILLFYIVGNSLYYRQQRERFQTERLLRTFSDSSFSIRKVGMNSGDRIQLEVWGFGGIRGVVFYSRSTPDTYTVGTSVSANLPNFLDNTERVYAVVMSRGVVTAPVGWSFCGASNCTLSGVSQDIQLYSRVGDSAISGSLVSFSQSTSNPMGLMFFVLKSQVGVPILTEIASSFINESGGSTITSPTVTGGSGAGDLVFLLSTSINENSTPTAPTITNATVLEGVTSDLRFAVGYQYIPTGVSNTNVTTFSSVPAPNGLACMTARFVPGTTAVSNLVGSYVRTGGDIYKSLTGNYGVLTSAQEPLSGGYSVRASAQALIGGAYSIITSDPYAANVTLLVTFEDGGSSAFTDKSPLSRSLVNHNVAAVTAPVFQGVYSGSFFISDGPYLYSPTTPESVLDGDLTVEGFFNWSRPGVGSTGGYIFSFSSPLPENTWTVEFRDDTRKLSLTRPSGYAILGDTLSPNVPENTFFHWAVTRSGSTITLSLGGVSAGTYSSSDSFGSSSGGMEFIGSKYIAGVGPASITTGYFDNVRVTKVARYTTFPFTPPSAF